MGGGGLIRVSLGSLHPHHSHFELLAKAFLLVELGNVETAGGFLPDVEAATQDDLPAVVHLDAAVVLHVVELVGEGDAQLLQ